MLLAFSKPRFAEAIGVKAVKGDIFAPQGVGQGNFLRQQSKDPVKQAVASCGDGIFHCAVGDDFQRLPGNRTVKIRFRKNAGARHQHDVQRLTGFVKPEGERLIVGTDKLTVLDGDGHCGINSA